MSAPPTSNRLTDAFDFAEQLHRDQRRKKTGAPTISHLMSVAALVMEAGGDEDQAIAALLHDGPEDCGGEPVLASIQDRFGNRVAAMVADCTDTMEIPKPSWEPRKRRYLERLETVPDESLLVSICDKVHNTRSILDGYRQEGDAIWERFSATKEQAFWYYESLLGIYRRRTIPAIEGLIAELDRVIGELRLRAGSQPT